MASGGRNWFPNAYLEFHWVFLPSFKDWMIWSTEKTGIRGRFFLLIIILLQDSKDTLTSASALARSSKHNYFSSSLTPGCSSWYFWMSLESPRTYVFWSTLRKTGLLDWALGRKPSCGVQCSLGLKQRLAAKTVIESKWKWRAVFVNGINSLSGKKIIISLTHH